MLGDSNSFSPRQNLGRTSGTQKDPCNSHRNQSAVTDCSTLVWNRAIACALCPHASPLAIYEKFFGTMIKGRISGTRFPTTVAAAVLNLREKLLRLDDSVCLFTGCRVKIGWASPGEPKR